MANTKSRRRYKYYPWVNHDTVTALGNLSRQAGLSENWRLSVLRMIKLVVMGRFAQALGEGGKYTETKVG